MESKQNNASRIFDRNTPNKNTSQKNTPEKNTLQKKNKGFRFTWFDGIIIAFFLLLFLGFIAYSLFANATEKETITYNIFLSKIEENIASGILLGDAFFETKNGECLGSVTAVNIAPFYEETLDPKTLTVKQESVDGMVNVYLTMNVDATNTEQGYKLGDYLLATGQKITLRGIHYQGQGVVLACERVE